METEEDSLIEQSTKPNTLNRCINDCGLIVSKNESTCCGSCKPGKDKHSILCKFENRNTTVSISILLSYSDETIQKSSFGMTHKVPICTIKDLPNRLAQHLKTIVTSYYGANVERLSVVKQKDTGDEFTFGINKGHLAVLRKSVHILLTKYIKDNQLSYKNISFDNTITDQKYDTLKVKARSIFDANVSMLFAMNNKLVWHEVEAA
jgi:hypothetical protein